MVPWSSQLNEDFLKKGFAKIDTDGDGFLCDEEINEFIDSAGITITEEDKKEFMEKIMNPKRGELIGKCVYEDFHDFILLAQLTPQSTPGYEDKHPLFTEIDEDGDGTITDIELIRWMKKSGVEVDFGTTAAIMKFFDGDGDGHITLEEIEQKNKHKELTAGMVCLPPSVNEKVPVISKLLEEDDNPVQLRSNKSKKKKDILGFLENLVAADPRSRKDMVNERWAGFVDFNRTVEMGIAHFSPGGTEKKHHFTVMKGGEVQDVLPGKYTFNDVFGFDDLPVQPRFTEVRGVQWISNKTTGKGSLKFPSEFDGKIEVEIGTNEYISYYGCTITNTRPNDEVTLHMRHAIEDFTYSANYLQEYILNKNGNNGAGLERHSFSHVDVPKYRDNGIFMLAKFVDEEETIMHLTGFQIPQKHCIFIPGGTIHINDYLKGTWRTMLSDAAPIDYVYLEKGGERFHFRF